MQFKLKTIHDWLEISLEIFQYYKFITIPQKCVLYSHKSQNHTKLKELEEFMSRTNSRLTAVIQLPHRDTLKEFLLFLKHFYLKCLKKKKNFEEILCFEAHSHSWGIENSTFFTHKIVKTFTSSHDERYERIWEF